VVVDVNFDDFFFSKAPETGDYRFYIASDDSSQLRLSTDDSKVNARRIAGVNGHTNPKQWNKYVSPNGLRFISKF
jgi:hypothetical protein